MKAHAWVSVFIKSMLVMQWLETLLKVFQLPALYQEFNVFNDNRINHRMDFYLLPLLNVYFIHKLLYKTSKSL